MGFFTSFSLNTTATRASALPRCGECGLYKTCRTPKMVPSGSGKLPILFIGEAPGETEDARGKPFVGKSGDVLRGMLDRIDLDLDECRVTNSIICRPPKNEIKDKHVSCCHPNIVRVVQEFRPKVIVLVGMSAVSSVIGAEWKKDLGQLGRWVGWTIPSRKWNAWLVPTYHPSFLLRSGEDQALEREMRQHLRSAKKLLGKPFPDVTRKDLEDQVEVILDESAARKRLKALRRSEGTLTFDFECTGLKPERPEHRIVCASFCLNHRDTFACMITPELMPILSKVLLNPGTRKQGSNLKYEERWTRYKLGHGVANWYWDTMLAAHVLDNRSGITSVKFQAYVNYGITDYGQDWEAPYANDLNMIDRAPKDKLLLYCGMDSLIEDMVATKQQEILCL